MLNALRNVRPSHLFDSALAFFELALQFVGAAADASVDDKTTGVSAVTNSFATALQVIEQKAMSAASKMKTNAAIDSAQSASAARLER